MALARNEEKRLQHGWFVVRNRTPSEAIEAVDAASRHARELKFFNTLPWKNLPEDHRGTQALKKYLANLLSKRIQETFPKMQKTIRDRQQSISAHLESLGTHRETPEQQRTYLTTVSQRFHSLASDALRGRYDCIRTDNMKLRMMIRTANDEFASNMRLQGHHYEFLQIPITGGSNQSVGSTNPATPNSTAKSLEPGSGLFGSKPAYQQLGTPNVAVQIPGTKNLQFKAHNIRCPDLPITYYDSFQNISCMPLYESLSFEEIRLNDHFQDHQNLASSMFTTNNKPFSTPEKPKWTFGSETKTTMGPFSPQPPSSVRKAVSSSRSVDQRSSPIYSWIRDEVAASRGTELQGTLNPDVLPILFHKQASKWKALAEAHFLKVRTTTVNTVVNLLETVCPPSNTRAQIKSMIKEVDEQGRIRGLDRLSERLEEVLSGHLQTSNPAFEAEVTNARLLRFQGAIERYRSRRIVSNLTPPVQDSEDEDNLFFIDMRDTASLFAELHMSNSQNLEDEIHDILKAYYEIARNDFIEFVNQIIVERYLNDSQGPVLLFSPLYVDRLNDEELRKLTAEDESVVYRRAELKATSTRLKRAEEIALKYA